jgi:hypothetical protein
MRDLASRRIVVVVTRAGPSRLRIFNEPRPYRLGGYILPRWGAGSAAPVHGLAAIAERMNRYDQTPPRLFVQECEKKGVIGRFCARM